MDGDLKVDGTRAYYDDNADTYAKDTLSLDLTDVWRLCTDTLPKGAKILDLGCGAGRDLKYFSELGYQVVGIDYSESLSRIASDYSKQRVDIGDIRSLPYEDDSFDCVWAIASLLHIPKAEIRLVLKQIRRVLTTSGYFIASVKQGTGERIDPRTGRFFADYGSLEWKGILEANGFRPETIIEMTEERKGALESLTWIVSVSRKSNFLQKGRQ